MALDEFALISRFFRRQELVTPEPRGLVAGIGDDCALLTVHPGQELAFSMDLLVEGVHFPAGCDARQLGQRALRVNLSDLAAMGAEPVCFTLGLALPQADEDWLDAFSFGLSEVVRESGCTLVGGDVTRGPLTVCIQVHGTVPAGTALRRDGAVPGDDIYVTGTLGDAAAALPLVLGDKGQAENLSPDAITALQEAYYRPALQIRCGQALRGVATAAIDLSDGLASDLPHILDASGVGASIDLGRLPMSDVFRAVVPESDQWSLATSGGDDYRLCFTAPRSARDAVQSLVAVADSGIHRIGRVESSPGLRWQAPDGSVVRMNEGGYRHFSRNDSA